jgi:alanine racemase
LSRKTVARVHLNAIRHNLGVVRSLAPDSQIACVVKADAYGHGLGHVIPALQGAEILAVATPGGAWRCRDQGWKGRLLMLEGPSNADDCRSAVTLDCELVIHHETQLMLLGESQEAARQPLWLKLDSGMHRLGFAASQARKVHQQLTTLAGCEPLVLMSHLACADDPQNPKTEQQISAFDDAIAGLTGQVSLANSAGVLNFPASHRDIVRPGIMLYGASPCRNLSAAEIGIRPAMTLQCELIAINSVRKGESVGYGGNQVCPDDMNIGVAAIGYGDGYPHNLRSGTPVLVNGRRAPLFGPVSMDMITIDLSGHADAGVGDTVTLWGEGLPLEEVAGWGDLIPYELMCGVTARVRSVVEDS